MAEEGCGQVENEIIESLRKLQYIREKYVFVVVNIFIHNRKTVKRTPKYCFKGESSKRVYSSKSYWNHMRTMCVKNSKYYNF